MPTDNFRVQLSRGTGSEADNYVGRDGELFVDKENGNVRVLDGATPGGEFSIGGDGGNTNSLKIVVNDFTSSNFILPEGVTVTKEYSDSSLKITHNKNKYPINWFGINKQANPPVGIYPTPTINIQLVDANSVIITNIKDFNQAEYNLIF